MLVNQRLEQLYQRTELVKGMGDPRGGKFCIMSFVALLAGENHSDSPSVASPLIRRFAVPINDRMPPMFRQQLKPFAPRIIGTRDRFDDMRIELLLHAVHEEIIPRMNVDFVGLDFSPLWSRGARKSRATASSLAARFAGLPDMRAILAGPMAGIDIASATAEFIIQCAGALAPQDAAWYWNKAIDLLDRLCDISNERAEPGIDWRRIAWLETILERRARRARRTAIAARTLEKLRQFLSHSADVEDV